VRLRKKLFSLAAGALALIGASGQALATTVTLDTLVAGGTLTSNDGTLTFSNFHATVSGTLSHNLADYSVQSLDAGFRMTGAFIVADGMVGDMVLSYTATTNEGQQISDVNLFANATFNPKTPPVGLAAGVSETVFPHGLNNPIGILSVAATSKGFADLTDSSSLAPPPLYSSVDILKDIAVSSAAGGNGSAAHISVIDQNFTVTPEPGTLLLGSAGLLGLATLGRKRVR